MFLKSLNKSLKAAHTFMETKKSAPTIQAGLDPADSHYINVRASIRKKAISQCLCILPLLFYFLPLGIRFQTGHVVAAISCALHC